MAVTSARREPAGRAFVNLIDVPVGVRGASTGFTVLLLGGLTYPLAGSWSPALSQVWLPVVALIAFAVAARNVGKARIPLMHGAAAAVGSYLLMLPMVLLGPVGVDLAQVVITLVASLVTGAVVGFLRGRSRAFRHHGT